MRPNIPASRMHAGVDEDDVDDTELAKNVRHYSTDVEIGTIGRI